MNERFIQINFVIYVVDDPSKLKYVLFFQYAL